MFGLTNLGAVHTLDQPGGRGRRCRVVRSLRLDFAAHHPSALVYVVTTVLTCVTAFGIFRTGAFGPGHAIGVLTLIVLAFAVLVEKARHRGTCRGRIEIVSYTTTFFLHMIPAIAETTTRLPPSAPLAAGPNDPLDSRPRRRRVRAVHRGCDGAGATLESSRAAKHAIDRGEFDACADVTRG